MPIFWQDHYTSCLNEDVYVYNILHKKGTIELASVDLIRGVQKQRVNNKINLIGRNNPLNPQ